MVRDGAKVTLIPLAKLDYVQAQDDYVLLKTAEKSHLKQQTISSLETRLDPKRFLRIHRSFIIQLDRLARLEQTPRESWVAVLTDGPAAGEQERLRAAEGGAGPGQRLGQARRPTRQGSGPWDHELFSGPPHPGPGCWSLGRRT